MVYRRITGGLVARTSLRECYFSFLFYGAGWVAGSIVDMIMRDAMTFRRGRLSALHSIPSSSGYIGSQDSMYRNSPIFLITSRVRDYAQAKELSTSLLAGHSIVYCI